MLVVTADHGQVEVGNSVELIGPEIMEAVTLISGEGRFRWLHVRPGATTDIAATAAALHGDVAWVRTKEELVAPTDGSAACRRQRWHRAWATSPSVPFAPTAFLDPSDTGELRLKARHGSLTPAEVFSPPLGWRAS